MFIWKWYPCKWRISFKGKNQLPLIMFLVEYYDDGFNQPVTFAKVLWMI